MTLPSSVCVLLTIALLLSAVSKSRAAGVDMNHLKSADALINDAIDKKQLPGAVLGHNVPSQQTYCVSSNTPQLCPSHTVVEDPTSVGAAVGSGVVKFPHIVVTVRLAEGLAQWESSTVIHTPCSPHLTVWFPTKGG